MIKLPDFTFIKYLDKTVAVIFILCITAIVMIRIFLNHIRKQTEEKDIHDEIMKISDNHKEMINMFYLNQSNIPPPSDKILFLDEYRENIEANILEEKKYTEHRKFSPVRKRRKKRITHSVLNKRSKKIE